jgi:uncharacterized protein
VHRRRILGAVLAACLAGCSSGAATPLPTGDPGVPEALRALPTTTVDLAGRTLRVAVADTTEARRQGLMGIADLGSLDGMLFAYAGPVLNSFHMRDVPIPLDIAFFDADGRLLAVVAMAVCPADPCPTYEAPAPFRWAIETEAGGLSGLAPDARLSVPPSA